jgi:hypothetical protein
MQEGYVTTYHLVVPTGTAATEIEIVTATATFR